MLQQPVYYINKDNFLPEVEVVAQSKRIVPKRKTREELLQQELDDTKAELNQLKDPWALPSLEDFVQANLSKITKGKIKPLPKKLNPAYYMWGIPQYDKGTEVEDDDSLYGELPVVNVGGYHDMYNHQFKNYYNELPNSHIGGPVTDFERSRASLYTADWNRNRWQMWGGETQGEGIRNYYDKMSSYFKRGKGYNFFDKLFHTNRYKNARESWVENTVANIPNYGGSRIIDGAAMAYSPIDNSIYYNPEYGRRSSTYLHELTHAKIGNSNFGYNPAYEQAISAIPYEDIPSTSHDYRPSEAIANLYEFRAVNNLNPQYKFDRKDIKSLRKGIEEGLIQDTGLFSSFSDKELKKLFNNVFDCGKSIKPAKR